MQATEPSTTAKMTAIARGRHRLDDSPPWVLDDPFALPLVGPGWRQIFAGASANFSTQVLRQARAFLVGRSRSSEDRLAAAYLKWTIRPCRPGKEIVLPSSRYLKTRTIVDLCLKRRSEHPLRTTRKNLIQRRPELLARRGVDRCRGAARERYAN